MAIVSPRYRTRPVVGEHADLRRAGRRVSGAGLQLLSRASAGASIRFTQRVGGGSDLRGACCSSTTSAKCSTPKLRGSRCARVIGTTAARGGDTPAAIHVCGPCTESARRGSRGRRTSVMASSTAGRWSRPWSRPHPFCQWCRAHHERSDVWRRADHRGLPIRQPGVSADPAQRRAEDGCRTRRPARAQLAATASA
jgi:hypothetical protein